MKDGHDHEYTEEFVAGLEWIWGEGFLSPGGPDEIAAILEGLDLGGAEVLDIGCGLGAVELLLVREHGAARAIGIDIEPVGSSGSGSSITRPVLTEPLCSSS